MADHADEHRQEIADAIAGCVCPVTFDDHTIVLLGDFTGFKKGASLNYESYTLSQSVVGLRTADVTLSDGGSLSLTWECWAHE